MLGQFTTTTTQADTGDFITVAEAKEYLRVPSSQTGEDSLIQSLIIACVSRVEELTDVQLVPTKTVSQTINFIEIGRRLVLPFRFPASLRSNEAFNDKDGIALPASATEIFPTEFEIDTSALRFPYLIVSYDVTETKAAILKPAVLKLIADAYSYRGDTMSNDVQQAFNTHKSMLRQFRERSVIL